MNIYILLFVSFYSLIFSFNLDDYKGENYLENKNYSHKSKISSAINPDNQILDKFIDENTYNVGPGDVFLFNMITTNGIITLELLISPSGDVLIPIVGNVNLKGKKLKEAYKVIIDKCKEKYEDAFVYINLIKLRQFKILVTGNSNYAGMHIVSSTNRVSDLIESMYLFNYLDTLLGKHLFDYPKNVMVSKDITLFRNDSLISVDLFNYYLNGQDLHNPTLIEGDIVNISNTDHITILGEVNNPIRFSKQKSMPYQDALNRAGGITDKGDLDKIKFLNYGSISSYYNNEKLRISGIDPKYRSDTDESFLSARNKTIDGMIYISDNLKLEKFLNSELSKGDIVIIPQKSNFIEILGGINNPGTYLYDKNKTIYDYILNAGGYNKLAKKIYILDINSGSRIKVRKSFIPEPGTIIFIEEKIGYKKWDRIKDIISISASLASVLLVLNNILVKKLL